MTCGESACTALGKKSYASTLSVRAMPAHWVKLQRQAAARPEPGFRCGAAAWTGGRLKGALRREFGLACACLASHASHPTSMQKKIFCSAPVAAPGTSAQWRFGAGSQGGAGNQAKAQKQSAQAKATSRRQAAGRGRERAGRQGRGGSRAAERSRRLILRAFHAQLEMCRL